MASDHEIDNAKGMPWSSQDQLKTLMEFIASLDRLTHEERMELRKAAREFIEKRRPR